MHNLLSPTQQHCIHPGCRRLATDSLRCPKHEREWTEDYLEAMRHPEAWIAEIRGKYRDVVYCAELRQ